MPNELIKELQAKIIAQHERLAQMEAELTEKRRWIDDAVAACAKRGCATKEYTAVMEMRERAEKAEAENAMLRAENELRGMEAHGLCLIVNDLRDELATLRDELATLREELAALAHAADYISDKPSDNLTAGAMLREARRLVGLDPTEDR